MIETGSGALVGIEVKASGTVNAGDFKGLRKLADTSGDDFKLGVVLTMTDDRCDSATVLWLCQCLDCGRDSIFAAFRPAHGMQVCNNVFTYQEVTTV